MQEEDKQRDILQGPLPEDYENWIEWRGCRVHTPNWWWELVGIPGINDFQQFARKIQASFELPQAKSEAQGINNDYLAPLAPKCIYWGEFLPPSNLMFPGEDFLGRGSLKRLWPMHRPYNIGQKRPTHQCQADHAFWWGPCKDWGRWWNLM